MQVTRSLTQPATCSCVLTIGNFDGLHRGHQALLERLINTARELNLPAVVMTFEPHPRELLTPERIPARLTPLREKLELMARLGVDRVHVCHFNQRLAELEAEDFIRNLLIDGLAVRHLYVGDDFQFGRKRRGDFAMLQAAGKDHGFAVESLPTISWQNERVSSSAIRRWLAEGELEHAARLLGRPYALSGRVRHGKKLGRQIGFPTANIALKQKQLPMSGIFVATVTGMTAEAEKKFAAAVSMGTRPTVALGLQPLLEVHVLDFDGDLYGRRLRVEFLHKLRDEMHFANLDELTHHIARDVDDVRKFFQSMNHG